jgi:hypothetical protein
VDGSAIKTFAARPKRVLGRRLRVQREKSSLVIVAMDIHLSPIAGSVVRGGT